jgi:hypothetical protein
MNDLPGGFNEIEFFRHAVCGDAYVRAAVGHVVDGAVDDAVALAENQLAVLEDPAPRTFTLDLPWFELVFFFEHLETGARRAGRSLADLDLQAGGVVAFSDDVDRLIPPRKPGLAFSLGAMGSRQHNFYNDAYKRAGYADVALEVQRLWLDGRRDDATARVPDELVLKTNLLGTDAMVRRRLELYRDAGVTTLRVEPAGETGHRRLDHA